GSYARAPARLVLGARDATPRAARVLGRGYGAFLFLTRTRRVLDKYPELVFRIECVRALFPDARFLFLQRSGAATCRSIAEWSRAHAARPGGARLDWWGRERRKFRILVEEGAAREPDLAHRGHECLALERQEDMAALEWILATRAGRAAAERHPAEVLAVRYEELATDPGPTLERVQRFVGLAPCERLLAYAERSARPP